MNIEQKTDINNNIVVEIEGEFDAEGSAEIRHSLEEIAQLETNLVTLDIYKVSFIDSSGIGSIVFLYKSLKERDIELKIIGVHGQPREILELLRIHKAIPVELVDGENPLTDVT